MFIPDDVPAFHSSNLFGMPKKSNPFSLKGGLKGAGLSVWIAGAPGRTPLQI
jgi:hypothetical protein